MNVNLILLPDRAKAEFLDCSQAHNHHFGTLHPTQLNRHELACISQRFDLQHYESPRCLVRLPFGFEAYRLI